MLSYLCALRLPAPVCRRLASLCYGIPHAQWEPEENFILSLFPIGKVDDSLLDDIKETLKQVAIEPAIINLNGIQCTPIGHSQARIWVSVENTPTLESLQ